MKQRSTSGRPNNSKSAALVAMGLNQPRALAATLAAALAAPTDVAGIRYVKYARQSTVNEGETPLIPGGYRRHGITRYSSDYLDGSIGLADLDQVATTWNPNLRSKVFGGGVRESSYDGSEFEQYLSSTPGDKAGAAGGGYYSFEYTGRYLSFGARSFNQMSIEVDELDGSGPAYVAPVVTWAQNNLQVMVDTQRYKKRRYTLRGGGDFWFAGFATEQNIFPTPFNFLAGKPTYAFIGDSYWQSQAFDILGANIGELFIRLVGGAAQEASVWGGTGFAASGGGGLPFDAEARLQLVIAAKPDVVMVPGGINDGWPTYTETGKSTAGGIRNVFQRLRQELPAAILVFVTPFSPKESNWNNPDGIARQIRLAQIAEFERTPGPCIFLDGYLGGWRTSNGQTNLFDSGPWQTGDGWQGNPTGVGFGDTWTQGDATHLTPVGCIGLTQVMARSYKAALSALLGNRQYGFELPLSFRTAQQGVALDFTDLTDEKLAWRRNMGTETEFRNGVVDAPGRGGTITASTIQGYAGALTIARDSYAYKQTQFVAGQTYVVSVLCYVDTGVAPVLSATGATSTINDFALVGKGDALDPATYVVTEYGAGVWRVSAAFTPTTTVISNWGVVKYATNLARSLRVTGYQLERGTLSVYQPLTDVAAEFLAAFPIHSLYQDNVANLPAFSPEQPVGMVLDMRMGGARGLEVNPDVEFNTPGSWTTSGATPGWSVANGVAAVTATATANRWLNSKTPLVVGRWYEVFLDLTVTAGSIVPDISGTPVFATTSGRKHWILQASTTTLAILALPAFIGSIDNLSVKEVAGNHAVQATVGDRPILDGRFNRLTYSEQFSNAAWQKLAGVTVVENTDAGPNGVMLSTVTGVAATTTYLQQANIAAPSNAVATFSAHIKQGSSPNTLLRVYNSNVSTMLASVVVNWSAGVPSVGTLLGTWTVAPTIAATAVAGVYRISGQINTGAQTGLAVLLYPSSDNSALSTKIGGVQLTYGIVPTQYQRIGAATDYDAIGFPKGARFNGTNSWMQIANFDLTASDRVVGSVSMRRDSDAAIGVAFEHGPTATATSGTFAMFTPNPAAATVAWRVNGATSTAAISANVAAAPQFSVLTGYADLGNAVMALRQNGVVVATDLSSRGPGNFTAQTFYIGRRAGNALPLNGVLYRLGVRGGNYDTFLNLQERWVNEPVKLLA